MTLNELIEQFDEAGVSRDKPFEVAVQSYTQAYPATYEAKAMLSTAHPQVPRLLISLPEGITLVRRSKQ